LLSSNICGPNYSLEEICHQLLNIRTLYPFALSQEAILHTGLCELLNIKYPVIQAGMGGHTTPELVAAVSNAGGLGILGASRLTAQQLKDAIQKIKSLTNRPFGVNLVLAPPEPGNKDVALAQRFLDQFRQELNIPSSTPDAHHIQMPPAPVLDHLRIILEEEKIPVLSIGLGDPTKLAEEAHSSGTKVMAMVTTVEEAVKVEKGGVDIVVAQGSEAGGHRSTFKLNTNGEDEVPMIGTLALVPQVVDAISIPVVAAGGIMDGRGLVASLALGAAGVLLGTCFMVARESGTFQAYRERMFAAKETDTVITRSFSGRPARSIRNRFIEEYRKSNSKPLAWPLQALAADDIYAAAQANSKTEYYPLLAGQGLRLLKKDQGAAEIIREIVQDASKIISGLKDTI
jgi:nitronate monooxygenase